MVLVQAAAALALAASPLPGADEAHAAEPGAVTVSLTFDDGTADHAEGASILASHGMRGTFYVNSGRLGNSGYLTAAQMMAIQDAGHEIGGHTVSHADLPTLGRDEAARQVCNDRMALLNQGFAVSNFAYPYGASNATVENVVQECGYNSARDVGDVVSPGACNGCPFAEQLPPANPYDINTPDSIKRDTSLADMQNYVLQAEQNGGGWVVLVVHRICDGCDPYGVAASQLDSFASWLGEREARGTTVRTVAEVIGGEVAPGVNGPPPVDFGGSTDNLLRNPSLETDTDRNGLPDCWQRAGYGTNMYKWSSTSDAHEGRFAQRVEITSYTSGDRRLITPQDLGACAPSARMGHTYQFSGWYKTTGNLRVVAYYRTAAGGWNFLGQGPVLSTGKNAYRFATWVTPSLPAAASAISVGFSLRSVGMLAADDFRLIDSDQTVPTVELMTPADGGRLRGTVEIAAAAADASGIDRVEISVGDRVVCVVRAAPYRCAWDTTTVADQVVTVTARAVDTAGNSAGSAGRSYTVENSLPPDTTAPQVTLTSPADGAGVDGPVTLMAAASDDDAISQVLFRVGGVQVGAASSPPYQASWDSRSVPDGTVSVTAEAVDRAGNRQMSVPVTVTVANNANDSTPPTSTLTVDGTAVGGWFRTATAVTLNATDDQSGVRVIRYTVDGSEPSTVHGQDYTAPFEVSTPTTVRYRAFDHAGNAEPARSATLNVDIEAPTAAVLAPAEGSTVTGTVYLKATVADNVSVARVWFYIDGQALGSRIVTPYQWKWDSSTVSTGAHTVYVIVLDPAGNQTRSATTSFTVA